MDLPRNWNDLPPEVLAHVERVVAAGTTARLPRLAAVGADIGLHVVADRHGVTCLSVRTADLQEEEIVPILRYRLGQYLLVGFVDPGLVQQELLEAWSTQLAAAEEAGDFYVSLTVVVGAGTKPLA